MAEKYFLSGLMLLSLAGALLLLINAGSASVSSLFFVAVLAFLAIVSFISLNYKRRAYTLLMIFFVVGITYNVYIFINIGQSLLLWVVAVANLLGFAVAISSPLSSGAKPEKAASKKKAVEKQLGPRQKKAKTVIEKKKKTKRRKRKK